MACPKCGNDNISFQREQTASVGGSIHKFGGGKSGHGLLWWLFIGSWFWIFQVMFWFLKVLLALCTLGLSTLFFRKKNPKLKGQTFTASKTINRTMAVCQNCGYSWKA